MSFARILVWCLGLDVAAIVTGAQMPLIPPPVANEHWTVEKALQRALEANPDFLTAKADYERQQGIRIQVRARMLPRVSLNFTANERDKGSIDRTSDDFAHPPDERAAIAATAYDAGVRLEQLVFDGLGSWNQTKRYKALEDQSRYTMEAVAHQTVAMVRQAFDAVLWRRRALVTEQQRVTALRQVVEWTEKKQAVGEVAEFENFRAQAELKLAEAAEAQALSDVAKAEQLFRRLLMIPDGSASGSVLSLEGELQPRTLNWTLSEAVAMAHSRRPDLSAAIAALKAAQYSVRAAYAGYLPTVQVTGSYAARSSYFDARRELEGWTAAVAAQWYIFDGFETRGRIKAELASRRAAETKLQMFQLQIDSQLRELYAGLELSRSSVDAQRVASDLGGRSLKQARRLHELGQASLEQVLQAELTNRQAELGLLEAIFNHNATIAQIEYSVGNGIDTGAENSR